jgi:hypothetical protein
VATDWQTPTELPDLRRVGIIALDVETNDEGLRADRGSAWPWCAALLVLIKKYTVLVNGGAS